VPAGSKEGAHATTSHQSHDRDREQGLETDTRLREGRKIRFDKFVKDDFLPYSKLHKRTYPDDVKICDMLNETFGRMMLSEINPPLHREVEAKNVARERRCTKRQRNPATVNREMCVLSKIFSLAFDAELIESNPCRRVRKFRTNSGRVRYLTFDEEAKLFEKLQGQEWVQRIVTMAINTGNEARRDFRSHLVRCGLAERGDSHSSLQERQRPFRSDQSNGPCNVGRTATQQTSMSFRVQGRKDV